ncbi:hypothetical protein HOD75_00700 [archaeon]|jgi:hypothetical protein|nr:hypothetical protein [archaeon]MBT4241395.1 hypothetical protein [archaeon]MBT4418216.1 hypothetical protein [archaeon]
MEEQESLESSDKKRLQESMDRGERFHKRIGWGIFGSILLGGAITIGVTGNNYHDKSNNPDLKINPSVVRVQSLEKGLDYVTDAESNLNSSCEYVGETLGRNDLSESIGYSLVNIEKDKSKLTELLIKARQHPDYKSHIRAVEEKRDAGGLFLASSLGSIFGGFFLGAVAGILNSQIGHKRFMESFKDYCDRGYFFGDSQPC